MKKSTYSIFIFSTLINSLLFSQGSLLYYSDFENEQVGKTSTEYWSSTNSSAFITNTNAYQSNQSILIPPENVFSLFFDLPDDAEALVIDYYMQITASDLSGLADSYFLTNPVTTALVTVQPSSELGLGEWVLFDGNNKGSGEWVYTGNTMELGDADLTEYWHNVTLVLKFLDSPSLDVYIDGNLTATDLGFFEDLSVTELKAVNIYGSLAGNTYIDDISITISNSSDDDLLQDDSEITQGLTSNLNNEFDNPDGDTFNNLAESRLGTNPNSFDEDMDSDGIPDDLERAWFGSLDEGALDDFDGDGIPNVFEAYNDSDPSDADSIINPLACFTVNSLTNGAIENEFLTISEAVTAAENQGLTYVCIVVLPGDYSGNVTLHFPTFVTAQQGSEPVILRSINPTEEALTISDLCVLNGFTIRYDDGPAIDIDSTEHVIIKNCTITSEGDKLVHTQGGGISRSGGIVDLLDCYMPEASALNNAPVMTLPLGAVTVDENSSDSVIELYPVFQDEETSDSDLIYIAASSDESLVTTSIVDGVLTLSYIANVSGSAMITVTAIDGNWQSVDAVFTVTVNALNNVPVWNSSPVNEVNATEDGVYSATLADNVTDSDAGASLTFSKVSGPDWLSVSANGTLSGTPTNGDVGANSWTVRVSDGTASAEVTLNIAVDNTNDAPVAMDDSVTTNEDTAVVVDVLFNDSDADGDSLSAFYNSDAVSGSVVYNADGTFTYTPDPDFSGADSFNYTIDDNNGSTDTGKVIVTIIPVNDMPTWNSDPINEGNATEDGVYSATLADNATDDDAGALLTFSKVSGPDWLSVSADGTLSGTPTNSDVGANSWTVRVSDGTASAEVTLNISVDNTNDAPVFTSDSLTIGNAAEDTLYSATIGGSATDVDGDPLTYSKVSGPGWLSVAADGTLSGTPSNGDVGANVFTVQVVDGNNGVDNATLNITVEEAVMYVQAITVGVKTFWSLSSAFVDVTIYDNSGNPVGGANVSGAFSGGINQSFSGITDLSGTTRIASSWIYGGISNLTFTVNNVTHPTLTYAPEDNVETSDSFINLNTQ